MSVKVCKTVHINDPETVELRKQFFKKIDETLRSPLQLACRNKRSFLNRKSDNQDNKKHFLQDYFITLSDLMIFYFVTKILNDSEETKKMVEEDFASVCFWYNQVKMDSKITEAFLIDMKPVEFKSSISFDELNFSEFTKE